MKGKQRATLIGIRISTAIVSLKATTHGRCPPSPKFQFPLRRPGEYKAQHGSLALPRGEGGMLQMLAFTQVNSLTDIKKKGQGGIKSLIRALER